MIEFDRSKSLQELENEDWGEPDFDSYLVQECHRLSLVPLKDFTIENLRIMIGQNFNLNYLMPLAIEKLEQNPLVEGDYYAGDLLVNVLRADSKFWTKFPDLKSTVAKIADEALEIPTITKFEFEAIRDAYNLFLRASASLR
ncbi:MAG: contact-dependent growth inhibition system immunity protein [Verrucomicrobiota bacterium]